MILPDDADDLMSYFKSLHPDVHDPRHLPDKKGGDATLIGGRCRESGSFFYVSHDELRRHRDFHSVENEHWWMNS